MGLAGPCVDKPRVAEWRGVEEGDGLAGGRPIGSLTGFTEERDAVGQVVQRRAGLRAQLRVLGLDLPHWHALHHGDGRRLARQRRAADSGCGRGAAPSSSLWLLAANAVPIASVAATPTTLVRPGRSCCPANAGPWALPMRRCTTGCHPRRVRTGSTARWKRLATVCGSMLYLAATAASESPVA